MVRLQKNFPELKLMEGGQVTNLDLITLIRDCGLTYNTVILLLLLLRVLLFLILLLLLFLLPLLLLLLLLLILFLILLCFLN